MIVPNSNVDSNHRKMTTRMEPSTRSSSCLHAVAWPWRRRGDREASQDTSAAQDAQEPIPFPEEPNLFHIPKDLCPTYRSVPTALQLGIWCVSGVAAAFLNHGGTSVRTRVTWMHLFLNWRKVLVWLLETTLFFAVSLMVVQEIGWSPSRVPISLLRERYFLPSRLSSYNSDLGVHYVHVAHETASDRRVVDALYVNHGFGASSLSWLPALPVLTSRFNCRRGLGHDARGFGFSARSASLKDYTSEASAEVGLQLLQRHLSPHDGGHANASEPANLLLLGHSMGAVTTLRMVRRLQERGYHRQHVVLVAPALGLGKTAKASWGTNTGRLWQPMSALVGPFLKGLSKAAGVLARWLLRRFVGTRGFWRRGLSLAWGDPGRLTEADVARFQWPSILRGWEQGLLDFSRAQWQPSQQSDKELLELVLQDPNTTVSVVLGSRDRVVSPGHIHTFFKNYPAIQVVVIPGLGHDPFEEDVSTFVDEVEQLLAESTD